MRRREARGGRKDGAGATESEPLAERGLIPSQRQRHGRRNPIASQFQLSPSGQASISAESQLPKLFNTEPGGWPAPCFSEVIKAPRSPHGRLAPSLEMARLRPRPEASAGSVPSPERPHPGHRSQQGHA